MNRFHVKVGLTIILCLILYVAWRVDQVPAPPPTSDASILIKDWQGVHSGYVIRGQVVIRDDTAWREVWDKIYGPAAFKPKVPYVDFDRHMVVAVFSGQKQQSGHRVSITHAKRDEDILWVSYQEEGPDSERRNMLTSPFHVAVFPAAPQVKFKKE